MLAAKQGDLVIGMDIHILLMPPFATPAPIPHPHMGMVMEPLDNVGGAQVMVNNKPAAKAGSAGMCNPPHIPQGGPFMNPPPMANEIFMGSSTVLANNSPWAAMGAKVLSCTDIGMPPPPRSRQKTTKPGLYLPTSTLTAIPAGAPVMIGGAPTIDMMAMSPAGAMGPLVKMLNTKQMKQVAEQMHEAAGAALEKVNAPQDLRNQVHKDICFVTGHPVDIATGKVFTDATDIRLPGPIPFKWERTWFSTSAYKGSLGHGWHHSYDMALCVDADRQVAALRMGDGRPTVFPFLQVGEEYFDRKEKLTFLRDHKGWGVRNKQNHTHRFHPSPVDPAFLLLSRIEDIDDHAIEFTYDLQARLKKIVDSGGRVLDIINNAKGQITEIRTGHLDDNYKLVNYYYDSYGDLVQVLDAADRPVIFSYQNHLLVKETNRNGLNFYFTWMGHDQNAKCMHTWGDGDIYNHKMTYKEGVTEVTNSLGHKSTYILDGQGLVSQIIDANGNSTYFEYSPEFDIMTETDAAGLSTSYSYDERGNEIAKVMPDGATYTTQYDKNDLPTLSVDPAGMTTFRQYDEKGRLIMKIDPDSQVTQYSYANGNLETITKDDNTEIRLEYDKSGNLAMVQFPDSGIYHWRFDKMGNVTMSADPKGNTRQFIYDKMGHIMQVSEPDGNVLYRQYDGEGNVLRSKDNLHDVQFEYTGVNRLHARIQNNTRVEFIYDTEEKLTAIKNEHGFAFGFKRDVNGNVIEERGFDGIIRRYERDGAGKVKKIFRQGGIVTTYSYDDGGRIEIVENSDGAKEQYAYGQNGELMFAQNEFITVECERDQSGRVLKEKQGKHEVVSEYDKKGFRTRIISSAGADINIERNPVGNLAAAVATNGKATWQAGIQRDILGYEIERSLPGGLYSKWERDRLGRPMRHTVSGSVGKLSDKSYRWDVNDRLRGIFNELQNVSTIFTHDEYGNLASAQYEDGHQDYRLPDAVGNLFRTKERNDKKYGPAGQLLEANGVQYNYDAEGNLIRKVVARSSDPKELIGAWEYRWYANGTLKEVLRPDGETVSFKYDAIGRRIAKTFKGNTTRWIWDGDTPLHEWVEDASDLPLKEEETVLKVDNEGQLVAQTAWHAKLLQPVITWVFEPESFTPMAKLVGETNYSIITDHIGTPVSMHDDTGTRIWNAEYDIYGKIRNLDGRLSACPFRYQGQYEDEETGLYYNRYRYYDANTGRYVSQDPVTLHGGMEFYSYVPDPTTWVDALGLDGDETLKPGPYAKESIPAASKSTKWENDEVAKVTTIGKKHGCHTCGTKDSGTKAGNFIPDHQPPSALVKDGTAQQLYPHCLHCSRVQGGQVNVAKRKGVCLS